MKINVTAIAEEAKAAALLLPWDLVLTLGGVDCPTRCPTLAEVAAIEQAEKTQELRNAVMPCIETPVPRFGDPAGEPGLRISDDELPIVAGAILAELSKKKQAAVAVAMRKHLSTSGK